MAKFYRDLVFAHNNEQRLVDMAHKLGFSELMLCYALDDPLLSSRAKEVEALARDGLRTTFCILVQAQQDVSKARSLTEHVVSGNAELAEDKRVKYLIDMESGRRDDFIHHRNAGLTQVGIANALRTGKTLLVNAHQLLENAQHPAVVLGRMMQNNTLYHKYEPLVLVVSGATEPLDMRAPRDLQNLLNL